VNDQKLCLITICLNEMQWLPDLYSQHKDWPGLERWAFVEAADEVYETTNPHLVSPTGLSVDGTSQFLDRLASQDDRVKVCHLGRVGHRDKANGKVLMKQKALELVQDVRPDFVFALDADEFYTVRDQERVFLSMSKAPDYQCYILPRREIWHPPSLVGVSPLFGLEVVGGFWGIPCCHWWRWCKGMHFGDCHNTPSFPDGRPFNDRLKDLRTAAGVPHMIHMGFASVGATRKAKNRYYADRGEANDKQRSWYVESRAAWEDWTPGTDLPHGAKVVPYDGPVPECFAGTKGMVP